MQYNNFTLIWFQIKKELNGWGLQFSSNLVSCSARNIADKIKIVSGNRETSITNSDWTRETNCEINNQSFY